MIIILGAEQRSFLTMERRGSLEISLPLSLSPCLPFSSYSCLLVWHRILFYISIISLSAALSFLLPDPLLLLLLLVSALCPRKLSCSFCLSFVTEVSESSCARVFGNLWKIALSQHYPDDFTLISFSVFLFGASEI